MTKREFLRLEEWEQRKTVENAAKEVNAKLNLFGRETVEDLLSAAREGEGADERYIDNLLTPSPDFSLAFCEAARPACNRYLRYARYWRMSQAA